MRVIAVVCAALLAAGSLLFAYGFLTSEGHRVSAESSTTRGRAASVAASAASTATLAKPLISGLIAEGGYPPTGYAADIQGWVVNVKWSDLQPTLADNQANQVVHPNAIDDAITYIQKHSEYAHDLIKIRVFAGDESPTWAMNLGGSEFQMNDFSCGQPTPPAGCNGGTLSYWFPRWWASGYQSAYDRLEQALAANYDSLAIVSQIDSPRCMMIWTEPMVRPWDPWSMTNLLAAGYTSSADVQCQQEQVNSLAAAWHNTNIEVNMNTYYDIFRSNGVAVRSEDLSTTQFLSAYCRTQLGPRCVLQNNELGRPSSIPANPNYDPIYPILVQEGPALSFQMDNPVYVNQLPLSSFLAQAVSWGANAVELPNADLSSEPAAFFVTYDQQLMQNPIPAQSGG